MPTAAHFIYIPAVLLIGVVIGWILGSRAAADAYAAHMRRHTSSSHSNAVSSTGAPGDPGAVDRRSPRPKG